MKAIFLCRVNFTSGVLIFEPYFIVNILLIFILATERPSPPLNFNYTHPKRDSVQLAWDIPLSNGGSMITGYIIEKCEDGTSNWLRCNARLCPDLYYRVRMRSRSVETNVCT